MCIAFSAAGSGQCWDGWEDWDSVSSSPFPEKQRKLEEQVEEERNGHPTQKWSMQLTIPKQGCCYLPRLFAPASVSLSWERSPPLHRIHITSVAFLPLQYLNRQRKLAVVSCSATRELASFFIAPSPPLGGSDRLNQSLCFVATCCLLSYLVSLASLKVALDYLALLQNPSVILAL